MRLERCGVAVLLPVSCSWYLPLAPFTLWRSGEDIILISKIGCAGRDLNPRPLAYEASEIPDCSTAQFWRGGTDSNRRLSFRAVPCCHGKTCSTGTLCPAELPPRYFRLPFVKEQWYYRIHHLESQGQKIHPAVCGRQGAPLWRNESGFLPITAKSVGVRCCVGLRRCLCWLDGSRHLAVTASLHDAEVGIGLGDLI